MKTIVVVILLFLGGCSTIVPMSELERQAMLTGDWSDVERRERILQRRAERHGPDCGVGKVSYCKDTATSRRCKCLNDIAIQEILAYGR